MKKASKWFRGLLGLKKPDPSSSSSSFPADSQPPATTSRLPPPKKKWSFVKSYREKDSKPTENSGSAQLPSDHNNDDPSKHAIAVAAATAAVAEAAVAAAQAAAEVVRLTSSGRAISTNSNTTTSFGTGNEDGVEVGSSPAHVSGSGAGYGSREEEWAAVKIQSHFRAYLSRRALRALKALVKLQALVRGHIVRKHTADILREMQAQMQAMLRAQARASAGRAQIFESPYKSNHTHYPGPATPEKFEHIARAKSMKHGENLMFRRNSSKNSKILSNQDSRTWEHEGSSTKIGWRADEVNGSQIMQKRRNLFHSSYLTIGSDQCSHHSYCTTSKDSTAHQTVRSLSSCEVQSASPLKLFSHDVNDDPFLTAENSPHSHSKRGGGGGPITPTKSDGSRSCLSGYSDYPNYMSCTQSSKSKIRSLSAPKQRPQYERSSSTKRLSINPQRVSALHTNFTTKAYPGSGHLDRLGMPVREEAIGFSGGSLAEVLQQQL
ncbi:hypothetical protein ACH5RR_038491 [Cinchona calisaya]|uniref:DUF4005 domain-containing protein n=1 Tax=Cinchona calisaya TaxID=153742 RepID=A0ABD2Y121_9GENT